MKSRQDLVEMFSSFLNLDADGERGWIVDPKLQRSMRRCLEQSGDIAIDRVWALYWHRVWHTETKSPMQALASAHLAAYVQEVCYWSAKKILFKFPNQQSLADLFQTAIVGFPKILKNFNPQLSSSFKSYAEPIFNNVMKDSLRKNQEIYICSNWGLLNKLSQKRLIEALNHAGLSTAKIADYVLAWRCYQELYTSEASKGTRQLAAPTADTWRSIVQLYNQQRLTQQPTGSEGNAESLEKWLNASANAVRRYQSPTVISANAPISGQETGELLDRIPATQDSFLGEMMDWEEAESRQIQRSQMGDVLNQAIAQLDPQLQTVLHAYYGTRLTQQEISTLLGVKQYTISRRLTSIRGALLRTLSQWAQDSLHVVLSPTVLDAMNNVLEEWLTDQLKESPTV